MGVPACPSGYHGRMPTLTDNDVIITDVGPRDGLQSQQRILSPAERAGLIRALASAGVRHIEAGAFVSPKAVPAMAHTDQVLAGLGDLRGQHLSVLVPNLRGYELARAAGASGICLVLYASEGMARANVRMSCSQVEEQAQEIIRRAAQDRVQVTATIAVAFECPYDGPVDPAVTLDIARRFLAREVDQLCVADTIGAAHPWQVRDLTRPLAEDQGCGRLGCHFHDTRAMGLANVFAALESGIRKFDASIAGLGGCPFAPGASGNVATEDVAMMAAQMGFTTGIDLPRLLQAADLATKLTGTAPGGRASAWLRRHLENAEKQDD